MIQNAFSGIKLSDKMEIYIQSFLKISYKSQKYWVVSNLRIFWNDDGTSSTWESRVAYYGRKMLEFRVC